MKKKCILITLIITLLMNSMAVIPINSIATAEEGSFSKNELPYNIKFTKIAGGYSHTLALDEDGYLWGWGSNKDGELLDHSNTNGRVDGTSCSIQTTPVKLVSDKRFIEIAAGTDSSFAIDTNNNLWVWGNNFEGEFGLGDKTSSKKNSRELLQIMEGTKFSKISVSPMNYYRKIGIYAIDTNNNLWVWGDRDEAYFGDGREPTGYSSYSEPIHIMTDTKFKDVEIGVSHTLAIDTNNNLWAWGHNERGQVGNNSTTNVATPIQIKSGTKFNKIAAGNGISMAIDTNEDLWIWGASAYRKLGDTSNNDSYVPLKVKEGTKFKEIDIGYGYRHPTTTTDYSLCTAIDKEGNLWGSGSYESGLFYYLEGTKDVFNSGTGFQKIKDGRKFKSIHAVNTLKGREAFWAIDEEGNLWGGGENESGNIGTGSYYIPGAPWPDVYIRLIAGKPSNCVVTYKDSQNNTIETEIVEYGGRANPPTVSEKEGYKATWRNCYEGIVNYNNLTEDTVMQLTYEGNKYYVRYNGNGATSGSMPDSTHTYGTSKALRTNSYEKEGYTFKGWATSSTATEVMYEDEQSVLNLTSSENETINLYAIWEANEYTVTFKDGDTVLDTQQVTAGESAAAPEVPAKAGYTFTGWDKDFSNVTSDLTVNAQWTASTYHVTLNTNEGIIAEGENVTSYTYGVGAILPTPTKEGYTFAGWYINEDLTGDAINTIGTHATGDKTYYAKWEAGEGTAYKVEHYKQNLETNTYDKVETDDLSGKTGMEAVARPKTYEGYTENLTHEDRIARGEITADGNLVLKLYYDVNEYTVTFKNGDEVAKVETVAHGQGATAPALTKEGYVLRWDKTYNNVTTDITVNAQWLKDTDGDGIPDIEDDDTKVAYTVKHYKQVGNTNEYRLEETENLQGQLGSTVTAVAKAYEGYVENTSVTQRIPTGTVVEDGNLELRLFYDTIKHTVTFKDGDEIAKTETVAHGQGATAPSLTKDGYVLRWDKPYTNVTTDLTVNAVWLKDTDGDGIPDIEDDDTKVAYTVKHYKQVENTNEYRLEETENLQGQLGSTVTAVAKAYEGYVENTSVTQRIPTGTVVADGSLELKLFYDTIKQVEPTQATYKVEHYLQTKTGYELRDTQNLTAKIGDTVTATAKTYVSHNINKQIKETIESGVVTQDGKLVLKLYYDYKQFTVIFKDGDKVVSTQTVIYGGNATAPKLTKPGYILSWNKAINNITGDTTLLAVWTKDPNYVDPNDGKEERPSILPKTGEDIAMFMMVSGISMMIAGAGIIFYQKRKK